MLIYKRYLVNLAAIIISKMPTLRFLALNYKQRQISHFVVMNIFETNSFLCSFPHKNYRVLFLKLILSSLVTVSGTKLRRMRVPTQGSSSRQLSKLLNLSPVDAWYWKYIIVYTWFLILSLTRVCLITMLNHICACLMNSGKRETQIMDVSTRILTAIRRGIQPQIKADYQVIFE